VSRRRALVALPALLALGGAACGLLPERSLGERLWRDRCADCHGIDARGNTVRFMGNPWADLTDGSWKTAGDPSTVAEVTRAGIVGLMPAADDLTDEEMTALLDWLYYLRGERQ
jgi:cytochrome c oxidase cbb3-type subunit 3